MFVKFLFSFLLAYYISATLVDYSTSLQPLSKGLLQRLMFNLCAHSVTRVTLVGHLLDMIKPESEGLSISCMATYRLHGCQWNIVYAQPYSANGNIFSPSFPLIFLSFLRKSLVLRAPVFVYYLIQ